MNTTTKKRTYRRKSSDPLDLHVEQLRESGQPLGPEAFSTAVQAFSKRFIEAMLQWEMDAHLSGTKPTETPSDEEDPIPSVPTPNKRIGFSQKTLKTEFGPLRLDIPRDRPLMKHWATIFIASLK